MKTCSLFLAVLVASLAASAQAQSNCANCQAIVGYIESYLQNNATIPQIEAALDALCENLPGITAECELVVSYGVPYIVNYILTNEDPKTFCTQIGLCGSTKLVRQDACTLCTLLVGYVQTYLQTNQNATIAEIEKDLNQICAALDLGPQCTNFVNTYVPQIVQMLATGYTPTQICTMLGLCSSDAAFVKPLVMKVRP